MDAREITAEKAYLTDVLARLTRAVEVAGQAVEQENASLIREQERMWEDTRHIVRDLDDAVELLSHNRLVDARHRSYDIVQAEFAGLRSMLSAPYFGRIDFRDNMGTLQVYIGRRSFMDEEDLEIYVYDWRSPIASMFYDFDCGPAHYESPNGIVEGEMFLKRQYRIKDGVMQSMYDANALVQDDILGEILSQQAGHSLKVIAESIQKEQNQAIRFLTRRNMLVLGPAGSGKTSVGLHHIAYLLYHSRGRLTSQEIVAVSANHAFNEYIAGILPDLYESDIQRVVFADLIAERAPGDMRIGGYLDQVEYLLAAQPGDARAQWIGHLYSTRFLSHLISFVDEIPIQMIDIRYEGEIIACSAEFEAHMQAGDVKTYIARLQRIDHYIQTQCEDYFVRNASGVREIIEAKIEREEVDLYTEHEVTTYIENQLQGCIAWHCAHIRKRNGLEEQSLLLRVVEDYLKSNELPSSLNDQFRLRMQRHSLFFEDMLVLLCVKACMGKLPQQEEIRQALVDEAQDYGVLQHFLLRAIYPKAVFTLLADTNQAVLPCIGIGDAELFEQLYPGEMTTFPLNKSYRSTGPIGALAASLIAHRQTMTYYQRQGSMPALIKTEASEKAVADILANQPYDGTTAILTKTSKEAQKLYGAIGAETGAGIMTETTDTCVGQINIMPFYLSKGLEFDRVIVVLGDEDTGMQDAHNLLFLYCTRALHELFLVCGQKLPKALASTVSLTVNRSYPE